MRQMLTTEPAAATRSSDAWRQAMKQAIRDPAELCRALDLPARLLERAQGASDRFAVFVPWSFVNRIRPRDPHDPLLRQVMPLADETRAVPGFTTDPVSDLAAETAPGVIRKYKGRALLITTGACAVHCRYCFRRHYPYSNSPTSMEQWAPAIDELSDDRTIREVILSGGDPLTIVDEVLQSLVQRLDGIPHVRRLRIHTRLPIMIPQRITDPLLKFLKDVSSTVVVVVHVNHPQEIDGDVEVALSRLVDHGLMVMNQAVLLREVNDDVEVLTELCEKLVDLRVLPYYLHQLDRVAGAAHFEVPIEQGRRLVTELSQRLPGYAIPRYVQDLPGKGGKHWLL